jgi:hypothetical protein
MQSQFRLDFESGRVRGKRFDITARKHPVAGQQVIEPGVEQHSGKPRQQPVAHPMTGAVSLLVARDAGPDHHVQATVEQSFDEPRGGECIIGIVAIHQNVDVRIQVGKAAPDDIAFALASHMVHPRARTRCHLDGTVGRVVVENVDFGMWQRRRKLRNHLPDGGFFVMARDDDHHMRPVRLRHALRERQDIHSRPHFSS